MLLGETASPCVTLLLGVATRGRQIPTGTSMLSILLTPQGLQGLQRRFNDPRELKLSFLAHILFVCIEMYLK